MVAQAPAPELPATDFMATPWLTWPGLWLLTTVATVGVIRQKRMNFILEFPKLGSIIIVNLGKGVMRFVRL